MSWLSKIPQEYKSRKLFVFLFVSILIMIAGLFMAADKLVAVITGLLGATGIYSGSNVGQGWVDAVHGVGSANVITAKAVATTTTSSTSTETVSPPKMVTTTVQEPAKDDDTKKKSKKSKKNKDDDEEGS